MPDDTLLAIGLAVTLATLFVVLVLLVLPVRIDVPLTRAAAVVDALALAMGILEACPTCGATAEELGRQGTRRWLYCPQCARNPWLAAEPAAPVEAEHDLSA